MSEPLELAGRAPRFDPGQVVITPGAIVAIEFAKADTVELLHRHLSGDWGDLDAADKHLNDEALTNGDRILSAYTLADGQRIWIITYQGDNTCILLPEEY